MANDLAVYFSKHNDGIQYGAPGIHSFSLSSDTNAQQNNVSIAADYNLRIDGTLFYKFDPDAQQRESLYHPANSDTQTEGNLTWIAEKIKEVKDFFSDINFYNIWIGEASKKIIFLGSGCTINSLTFTDNKDDNWVQRFDYSADITIPVTGGGTNPGPAKYLDTVTKHYISSIDENISISKTDLHHFDFGDYKLNSSDSNQYVGPQYTITRTLSAVAKTPGATGSLYYAKNAIWDLYNNSLSWTSMTKDLSIADIAVTQSMDEIAGSYTLTSTITAFTGTSWTLNKSYVNSYDVNITYSAELKRTVTINGTMKATKLNEPNNINESAYLPPREDSENGKNLLTNVSYKNQGEDFEEDDGRFKKIKDLYYNEIGTRLYSKAKSYIYNKSFGPDNNQHGLSETGYDNLLKESRSQPVLKNWSGHLGGNTFHLNPTPVDYQVTFNMPEQSIDYSITFDNSTLPTVPYANKDSIEYEETHGKNLYVTHEIFGGPPILQDLNTYGTNTRTVTYTANFPRYQYDAEKLTLNNDTLAYVQKVVDCFDPSWINGSNVKQIEYLTKFEQNLDRRGKYTMTKSWEW